MRTPPQHDRAALTADEQTLRACAARLEALAGELPAGAVTDFGTVLAALARRCEVASADLRTAAALFKSGPAESAGPAADRGRRGPDVQSNSD
ncbi:hypothetical protein [Actinospica robiniae]|uniref:hypothetical protein n=1 Tax=Actinospica robiniae TaxID=304901 RepID=UPI00041CE419|nr:hypothetical protein [Actinospica robiniae]